MKFFFKFLGRPQRPWEGSDFAKSFAAELKRVADTRFEVVDSHSIADVIMLVETVETKDEGYLKVLADEQLLKSRPDSCFSINYEDDAVGFLPGLYAGLPSVRFDEKRHRAACYLHARSEDCEDFALRSQIVKTKHLLSFRGAASHPIRRRIFEREARWKGFGPITFVNRWFNHTEGEKRGYLQEILESRFVLCPRGIAPASHRLFEVIQLGRAPIILADAWVPPRGPRWETFSIRMAESQLDSVPDVALTYAKRAGEMGTKARAAWEEWFSPRRRMVVAAEAVNDLITSKPKGSSEAAELLKWHDWRRHWTMGWTAPQKLLRRSRGQLHVIRDLVRSRINGGKH